MSKVALQRESWHSLFCAILDLSSEELSRVLGIEKETARRCRIRAREYVAERERRDREEELRTRRAKQVAGPWVEEDLR
jgi:hypothetical protein